MAFRLLDLGRGGRRSVGLTFALLACTGCVTEVIGGADGTGGRPAATSSAASGTVETSTAAGGTDGGGLTCVAFGDAADYTVGIAPSSVVVRDLDGDGKPDLVVTSGYGQGQSGILKVLRNAGDGTFAAAVDYAIAPAYAELVAAGDLDGDGAPDLVVAGSTGTVSVFFNAGDGTFGAPVTYAVGSNLGPLVIGDLNGDGKLDLALSDGAALDVLLNTGAGVFGAATSYMVGANMGFLAMGDVNGDGAPDLALVTGGGTSNAVGVLLNSGTGTFGAPVTYPVGSTPSGSLALGDLDGDGKLDLVVVDEGGSVGVLLNAGSGAFGPMSTVALPGSPFAVAVGDLNGDGKPDLAVTSFSDSTVKVLLASGGGAFTTGGSFAVGVAPEAVAIADLDGDGLPDLVLADAMADTVSVLLRQGCAP